LALLIRKDKSNNRGNKEKTSLVTIRLVFIAGIEIENKLIRLKRLFDFSCFKTFTADIYLFYTARDFSFYFLQVGFKGAF
jgi:hypothetical protein